MKILVATDGSTQAEAAIEATAKYVKTVTHLKIISVVEPRYAVAGEPFIFSSEIFAEAEASEKEKAKETLNNASNKLKDLLATEKPEISTQVFMGNPSQIIVEEAEKWKADLIIVGSHGYGFWHRTLLGSVSDSVTHHAPCSVLIIRENKTAEQ
ncbi:MAG: universal stress protein [Pyrinomonadaceae bacterium]|nr:universal stress protein [Pyrinomonadaceae bacterium]